jgi:hypothetical protein
VNAVETQAEEKSHVSQPSENQGSAATAPCAPEECRADGAQTDGGSAQGVASPDSTHRGIVSATCNFVARTSGFAARLLPFALFLLLSVLNFFFLALCRIFNIPLYFIHFSACILWHIVVTGPLTCAFALLWLSWLPLRGVSWLVVGILSPFVTGVMNLLRRCSGEPTRQAAGPPGSAIGTPVESTPSQEGCSQVSCACSVADGGRPEADSQPASQQVRSCDCSTCRFFALLDPSQHPDSEHFCPDVVFETNSANTDNAETTKTETAAIESAEPGITNTTSTSENSTTNCCTSPGSSQINCCPHNTATCAHAHTVAAAPNISNPCANTASSIPRAIAHGSQESTRATSGPNETPSRQADTTQPTGLTPQASSTTTSEISVETPAPVDIPRLPCPAGLDPVIYNELVDWLQDHVEPLFPEFDSDSTVQTSELQGEETTDARHFQPIVAPRRFTRLMRAAAASIEQKCSRIRTHQHSICNALIICTVACLAVLLTVSLGFPVPFSLVLALAACEGLAVGTFAVLAYQLRCVRRPLVMMTRGGSLADKLPQVRSWMGMALKEELDRYIAACVLHHQQQRPLSEEYYIAALLQAVGQKTPLHLTLTTVITDDTVNNDKPLTHFLQKAVATTKRWKKAHPRGANDDEINFIQEKIDEMNLDWEPDAETQEVIDFFEDIIANKDGDVRYRDVVFAEKQLAAIKAELAKPMAHFYELSTLDKLEWLLDHPRYAAQAERIDRRAAGRRKRTQPEDRERVPEFESLQFQHVEDMTVLTELRNYLLKVTGAITDVHVQAWRRRRMCLGENPLEVFAKVKDEALCIQAAGVLNFQADRELYALLTRKHTEGGAFFGNTLWGRVRDKVEQAVEARGYLQNSPDMYMEIATIWATKAHAVFIDAPATDLSFHLEIQADLKARGKPPTWATTDRVAVPTGAVKQEAQPSGSGAKAQDSKAGGKQDHKQKYYCDHCKKSGHSTDRCHALRALGQQAAAQQLALPAPPPVVTTVTPNTQVDARSAAWKPGSRLHNQTAQGGQQGGQPQQHQQERPKGSVRRCETCTRINNNQEVQHFIRTDCVLADSSKPPPEWLNSPVPLVRAEIQRRRQAAGMSALPPFQPKPKRVTFAAPVMMADPCDYAEGSGSEYPLLMMIRREATYEAVQYSHKRRPQELLSFNPHTRIFTCKDCNEECVAHAIAHNRPTHVFCRSCKLVHYSAAQLPDEWMHTSIWDVQADAAPENPLAVVVYEGGAFGSSIARTSSHAQSDHQVGPVSRTLPPIRTALPGAPTKLREAQPKPNSHVSSRLWSRASRAPWPNTSDSWCMYLPKIVKSTWRSAVGTT